MTFELWDRRRGNVVGWFHSPEEARAFAARRLPDRHRDELILSQQVGDEWVEIRLPDPPIRRVADTSTHPSRSVDIVFVGDPVLRWSRPVQPMLVLGAEVSLERGHWGGSRWN